ncbi:MAG: 50S ribosomal protein L25 [Bacteroidales bacterium]|jgi:large subunit ribosomal protein L25|nr:50S ribosomal protein L25 [Bacteroidales bacterium]
MKTVSISGSLRENVGKKDAKALRSSGLVPCVAYGASGQQHFYAPEKELYKFFTTPEVFYVELELAGKKILTMIQEAQFHKVSEKLLHVDFFELSDNRPIIMGVPIVIEGSSPGVLKGGKLIKSFRKLNVKALPANMPEKITINISGLEILDEVCIKDIPTNNYTFLHSPTITVVAVKTTRNVVDAPVAAEAASSAAPAAAAPAAAKSKPEAKK